MTATSASPGSPGRSADFRYFPVLDGLRALSIAMVFVGHLVPGKEVLGAAFGVTLFFFISGFLITRLLLAEFKADGDVSIGNFYVRRLLRLAPALTVFIVTCCVVFYFVHGYVPWSEVVPAVFYYTNYFKVWHPDFQLPFSILWSLAVEEHYYLLFPLALVWFVRRGKTRSFLIALSLLAAAICLWRFILIDFIGAPSEYILRATDTRADSILYGAILSLILSTPLAERWIRLAGNPATLAVALLVLAATHLIGHDLFRLTFRFSVQGLVIMFLMTAILLVPRYQRLATPFQWPVVTWIGRISYSLYLWHEACIRVVASFLPHASKLELGLSSGALTLAVASASYYGIERNMGRLRRYFGSHLAK